MKEITKLEKASPSDFTLCVQSFFTQKNARTAFFSRNYSSVVMKEIVKLEKASPSDFTLCVQSFFMQNLHQVYMPAAVPEA